nr:integrase, catalytic region, zinc finger, CCHC-type, peptidase aspartic, catalytic [Tanacetum cinerariifolium]
MTIETHNWASSAHQEFHKIVREEIFPIVNQVDARLKNFKIQFLKEVAKFVGDFKSLVKEADSSLAKHKIMELEIERLLKAIVSQDIISVVQIDSVIDTSDLQTELERTKERFENCIIKKKTEYAKLWNDWYKKCDECKYDKCGIRVLDNTKTKRPQPRSNTKNDRVPSASKSIQSKNKEVKVEEHHRNLLLSKKNKHISLACNNSKIDSQDVISKVVCVVCKKCLNSFNHDLCLNNCVNGKKSRGCSKHMTGNLKLFINFVWKFMGTVRFGNDHVAAILGFGDLQWGNILITRVYFVEGLGHNLFQ